MPTSVLKSCYGCVTAKISRQEFRGFDLMLPASAAKLGIDDAPAAFAT
jgi:hypothetical protein